MIVKHNVKPIQLTYKCPNCEEGFLELNNNGMTLASYPPLYQHICTHCKTIHTLDKAYPCIDYDRISEEKPIEVKIKYDNPYNAPYIKPENPKHGDFFIERILYVYHSKRNEWLKSNAPVS